MKKIYANPEIHEAEDDGEGLKLLCTHLPHLVFLDYLLPDMSGLEFLESLKKETGPYLSYSVIALTGHGDETIATEFLKAGAKDYLVKNKINDESLARACDNAIEKTQLKKIIYEKQKELYNFAHTVAHDLKAPLQRIISYAGLFENLPSEMSEKQKKYLHNIKNASKYSVEFIDSLINYSEVGRSQVELVRTNLNTPLDNALSNLEVIIKDTKTAITKTDLPFINGDELALSQLFQNLINNAIKFQKTDAPFVKINNIDSDDKFHQVTIEDGGIGIPEGKKADIFLPFNRLHSKNDFPGSGIGLATCKNIMEQHNGKIWVEPAASGGSIFYLAFPKA